jgi:uncharacterized nucleotidyltransferase DUF6036
VRIHQPAVVEHLHLRAPGLLVQPPRAPRGAVSAARRRPHAFALCATRAMARRVGIGYTDTCMTSRELLVAFDRYLAARSLRLEAVVVGGAALNLLGVVSRSTRDCDILHPDLPAAILQAARAFAAELRRAGEPLDDDWLNNGPSSLVTLLPASWADQLQPVFAGAAIELRTLGRADLLRTKLFALCDRALDLADCLALAPAASELAAIAPWLAVQDLHPDWPEHVRRTLADLGRRLGHGV